MSETKSMEPNAETRPWRLRNQSLDGRAHSEDEPGLQFRPIRWIDLRPITEPNLPPENPMPPRVSPKDYFFGPVLNELIERVTQNHQPGLPPAPESVINVIPTVKVTETHLVNESHCPVWKELPSVEKSCHLFLKIALLRMMIIVNMLIIVNVSL
ncbi:uncharacterized protein LOC131171315 [Hevea brasiliensis]|uniref:uncharacterized protein LOC131171315 n=1 Tax=Hevea brasiliensis TaxID=3981 RepID=UPI0025EC307E|nr:uncharacterized protein LOC131171315 [Hevea brasiliensis]